MSVIDTSRTKIVKYANIDDTAVAGRPTGNALAITRDGTCAISRVHRADSIQIDRYHRVIKTKSG